MDPHLRQPEEILAYRSLPRILGSKPSVLWSVGPTDPAVVAVQLMSDKHIGFLVVIEREQMIGVLSERDFARRLLLARKSPEETPVAEIMTRDVISVDLARTFADCLSLMHTHGVRHLPVVDKGKPIAVISVRDLLSEAVAHHAKVIAELERERLTFFTSTA
jgi:signal-transduction protein with cAMP-binding, CBS, and nucleotidyltransferase domain